MTGASLCSDMEAATPNLQHSFGLGPRGPNPKLGSEHTAPGPPCSEEQHHKPFFYIQSSQPYMPIQGLQWPVAMPVPMSYNPYYGYPGLGKALDFSLTVDFALFVFLSAQLS